MFQLFPAVLVLAILFLLPICMLGIASKNDINPFQSQMFTVGGLQRLTSNVLKSQLLFCNTVLSTDFTRPVWGRAASWSYSFFHTTPSSLAAPSHSPPMMMMMTLLETANLPRGAETHDQPHLRGKPPILAECVASIVEANSSAPMTARLNEHVVKAGSTQCTMAQTALCVCDADCHQWRHDTRFIGRLLSCGSFCGQSARALCQKQ